MIDQSKWSFLRIELCPHTKYNIYLVTDLNLMTFTSVCVMCTCFSSCHQWIQTAVRWYCHTTAHTLTKQDLSQQGMSSTVFTWRLWLKVVSQAIDIFND